MIQTSSRARRRPRGGVSVQRGFWLPEATGGADGWHDDLRRAQAALAGLRDAALLDAAAAWLLTNGRVPLPDPVPVAYGSHSGRPGVRQVRLRDDETVMVGDLRCTTPTRTAVDVLRRVAPVSAIVTVDALTNMCLTVPLDIERALQEHRQRPGTARAHRLLGHVEANAGSPAETRLRLDLIAGGLPRPTAQLIMLAPTGTFLGRADLGYEQLRLGVEYLGRVHVQSLDQDWDRVEACRAGGYELVGVTASTLRRRGGAASRVFAAVRRQQHLLGIAGEVPLL